jgi:hypothetical protein
MGTHRLINIHAKRSRETTSLMPISEMPTRIDPCAGCCEHAL